MSIKSLEQDSINKKQNQKKKKRNHLTARCKHYKVWKKISEIQTTSASMQSRSEKVSPEYDIWNQENAYEYAVYK